MASKRSILTAIALGGIVAATLDIGAAMMISGAGLTTILHFIASGLIGKAAFDGGAATAVLGAALQELMGLIIAAVFVLTSLVAPALRRAWVISLSAIGRVPKFSVEAVIKNGLAMLAFGLIVAWFAKRSLPAN